MIVKLIRRLFNKFHQLLYPSPPKYLAQRYPEYQIGQGTYGDLTVLSWGEGAILSMGSFTSVASGVKVFLGGEHRIDWVTTYPFNVLWESASQLEGHPKTKGNVIIGNDVWIGTEAIILSGVKIGDGAVIGARAVISRDVPPYSVVAGNPGKVVKYRFEEKVIEQLLEIAWWNWSEAKIKAAMPQFLDNDISCFIEKFAINK